MKTTRIRANWGASSRPTNRTGEKYNSRPSNGSRTMSSGTTRADAAWLDPFYDAPASSPAECVTTGHDSDARSTGAGHAADNSPQSGRQADEAAPRAQDGAPTPPSVYEHYQELIDRVIRTTAGREHLNEDDSAKFRGFVWQRLLETEALAQFRSECSPRTFLIVVVRNLFRDFRNQRWGKWRHSAQARRLGQPALLLETLMFRDGHTFDEAFHIMETNHRIEVSREELYALSLELPHRSRKKHVSTEEWQEFGLQPTADSTMASDERRALLGVLRQALRDALLELPAQDRLIFKLVFDDGFSIAQVAVALKLDQKLLYRRRDRMLAILRARLEGAGFM